MKIKGKVDWVEKSKVEKADVEIELDNGEIILVIVTATSTEHTYDVDWLLDDEDLELTDEQNDEIDDIISNL